MSQMTGPRPSDRFIPWYIALFFAMQAVFFIWLYHISAATHTGLVTEAAYEKGLKYNGIIAKAAAQAQLGWTAAITRNKEGITFALKDGQGRPLSGAQVKLWLVRPVHDGEDQRQEMEERAPGEYFAAAVPPEKGLWEARISAVTPRGAYQASKRMVFE